jgi:hypothetical protein
MTTAQDNLVAQLRVASVLDTSVHLGMADSVRPDFGLSAAEYYAAKFRRGEYGQFWFHHVARGAPWRRNAG